MSIYTCLLPVCWTTALREWALRMATAAEAAPALPPPTPTILPSISAMCSTDLALYVTVGLARYCQAIDDQGVTDSRSV